MTVFASPTSQRFPRIAYAEPANAQKILVFRAGICQTQVACCACRPSGPALVETIHGQKCSKFFLNYSRQGCSASCKSHFENCFQFSLTEKKNTRDGFLNWFAKV